MIFQLFKSRTDDNWTQRQNSNQINNHSQSIEQIPPAPDIFGTAIGSNQNWETEQPAINDLHFVSKNKCSTLLAIETPDD